MRNIYRHIGAVTVRDGLSSALCTGRVACFAYTAVVHKREDAAQKEQQIQWPIVLTTNPPTPTSLNGDHCGPDMENETPCRR